MPWIPEIMKKLTGFNMKGLPCKNRQESLEAYTETLKDKIKSIKIKELLLDAEAGKADGEIVLTVSLDVN